MTIAIFFLKRNLGEKQEYNLMKETYLRYTNVIDLRRELAADRRNDQLVNATAPSRNMSNNNMGSFVGGVIGSIMNNRK